MYGLTELFVLPFQGIFGRFTHSIFEFDSPALIAIMVYPLLAWAIVGVIKIRTARRRPWDTP